MKSIFKKNQVIISVIAIMLIAAGYMSYTTNNENVMKTSLLMDEEEYAGLGDAQLVSSEAVSNNMENVQENETTSENMNSVNSDENVEVVDTVAKEKISSYFTESRLERDKMYSQMLESYQKILENNQISDTQREIAQQEVKKINDIRNALMISENLIKNKGFEDIIIFVNGNSVNVVIKAKDLGKEQIAQIQNIVMRELEEDIENIHISCKE